MESESSSDCSSESSSESLNNTSDISDLEDISNGYVGEPEYTDEQVKSMKFSSESSSSSDEDEPNSSRLENLYWCKCHHCTVMPTFVECKCCQEVSGLLQEKLANGCVTKHKDFELLCLNKTVLETAFIKHRRYKKIFTDVKEMTLKYVNRFLNIFAQTFSKYLFPNHFFVRSLKLVFFYCFIRKNKQCKHSFLKHSFFVLFSHEQM